MDNGAGAVWGGIGRMQAGRRIARPVSRFRNEHLFAVESDAQAARLDHMGPPEVGDVCPCRVWFV